MDNDKLKWDITGSKELLHTPVFDVIEQAEVSATGIKGDYVAMEANDWTIIIPEIDGDLIALTAANEEAQRFYKSVPNSILRDTGIWIDV